MYLFILMIIYDQRYKCVVKKNILIIFEKKAMN